MALPVFPKEGLDLLARLARNNTVDWFHAHKPDYRALVQDPALAIAAHVNRALATHAPEYVNDKKSPLSRPNRDTRFSKDKSPYRTDVAVVFPRKGLEKQQAAGFFFRIDPNGAELIAGSFMPGPDELKKVRSFLESKHKAFTKESESKALVRVFGELQGERLKRVPKGVDADRPALRLLMMTQWYVQRRLGKADVVSAGFADEIVKSFRAATSFARLLDTALGNT